MIEKMLGPVTKKCVLVERNDICIIKNRRGV